MQVQQVRLLLAISLMVFVRVRARTAGYGSITQQYGEYIHSDETHAPNTLDYDEEQGINIKRTRDEINEENIDLSDKYKSEVNHKRYRRPHNLHRDGILYHARASTEKWDDDIQVDTHHRIFTKKNKVAKTGSKSEYEKLKFAKFTTRLRLKSSPKEIEGVDVYMDDSKRKVKHQDSQYRKWRKEDMTQEMEDSEEEPQWINERPHLHEDYTYYDVERFNKYKTNFAPINQKRNENVSGNDHAQSISPTSFAERELQAYLNGHRLRKAADDVSSSTTEWNTEQSSNATFLSESTPSTVPTMERTAGSLRDSVHRHRHGIGVGERGLSGGWTDVTGAASVPRDHFTFPHLSIDAALEEQWNRFVTEISNEANKTKFINLIYLLFLIIIIYTLQRYNQNIVITLL